MYTLDENRKDDIRVNIALDRGYNVRGIIHVRTINSGMEFAPSPFGRNVK